MIRNFVIGTAALAISTAALAADEYNVANGLTLNGNPLGMHGIDPVSMFAGATPGVGDAVHTSSHDGVDYYFATAETKEQFLGFYVADCETMDDALDFAPDLAKANLEIPVLMGGRLNQIADVSNSSLPHDVSQDLS